MPGDGIMIVTTTENIQGYEVETVEAMSRMIDDVKRLDADANSKCQVYNIPDNGRSCRVAGLCDSSETGEIVR